MHFKIKGGRFQLCETINQNIQNGMNYLEIAVSVPGNDQEINEISLIKRSMRLIIYLSEKLSNIFQKLYSWISIGVEKGDWLDEYRKNELIEVNFFLNSRLCSAFNI